VMFSYTIWHLQTTLLLAVFAQLRKYATIAVRLMCGGVCGWTRGYRRFFLNRKRRRIYNSERRERSNPRAFFS